MERYEKYGVAALGLFIASVVIIIMVVSYNSVLGQYSEALAEADTRYQKVSAELVNLRTELEQTRLELAAANQTIVTVEYNPITVMIDDLNDYVDYAAALSGFEPIESCPLDTIIQEYIFVIAEKFNLDFCLVMGLIQLESNFDTQCISKTQDYGLMQINIQNHEWLSETLGITDFLNPIQNVLAGCYMLSYLIEKYENISLALMCYNKGESAATELWNNGVKSIAYSQIVLANYERFQSAWGVGD